MKSNESPEKAVARFADGYLCSQSVLLAFAERLGVEPGLAARIGASLGAGMGRMGWTCGAVSGALVVIGLRYGHEEPEAVEKKERMYAKEKAFVSQFQAEHGTVLCRELLGFDVSTPEDLEAAREAGIFETQCTRYIAHAVEILEDLLWED
jgi:C_GCAxxG_C_C family probable redox protein